MSPDDIRWSAWFIWVFAGALFGLIVGWFSSSPFDNHQPRYVPYRNGLIACGIVTLVSGLIILLLQGAGTWVPVKHDLVALQDGTGARGSFFLGSGYIKDELSYFYYERHANGAISGGTIPASKAVIYEDSQGQPQLWVHHCKKPEGAFYAPICAPITIPSEFHIPPGSVSSYYNLDLRN